MRENEKKLSDEATDMEYVLFLSRHIENPCEDLHGHNIRDFYIRETRKALASFSSPEAKRMFENVICKYSE